MKLQDLREFRLIYPWQPEYWEGPRFSGRPGYITPDMLPPVFDEYGNPVNPETETAPDGTPYDPDNPPVDSPIGLDPEGNPLPPGWVVIVTENGQIIYYFVPGDKYYVTPPNPDGSHPGDPAGTKPIILDGPIDGVDYGDQIDPNPNPIPPSNNPFQITPEDLIPDVPPVTPPINIPPFQLPDGLPPMLPIPSPLKPVVPIPGFG